ncbi:MAG: hypothetical protein R2851_24785 [Caldilineaceae bacterium]
MELPRAQVFADGDAPNADDAQHWRTMPSLNDGVTWCEQRMIDTFAAVGLTGASKSVIGAMRARFPAPAAEVDWLDLLETRHDPAHVTALRDIHGGAGAVEFAPGDLLLAQGAAVDGLFFLEEGEAAYQTVDDRGEVIDQGCWPRAPSSV